MFRQIIALTVIISVAIGALPSEAGAQAVTPSEDALRSELVERLEQLASKLNTEGTAADSVVTSLKDSPDADTGSVLEAAAARGSSVGKTVGDMVAFSADVEQPAAAAETSHAVAIAAATDRANVLQSYSQNVHALAEAAKTEPLGKVLALVEKSYVPDVARTVIAPGELGTSVRPGGPVVPFSAISVVQPESSDGLLPFIVGLGPTTIDFPAVGAVLYKDSTTGALSVFCTGTLIKPYVVLTAEHCVTKVAPIAVYFQHAGTYAVDNVEPYAPIKTFVFPYGDVALIYLKNMVLGITPINLNDKSPLAPSTVASIVGYGYHSSNASATAGTADVTTLIEKTGIKVHAEITTGTCVEPYVNKKLICWTYNDRPRSTLSGSTCVGDSGGPLFVAGAQWTVAGTTSGGKTCLPGDNAVDTDIYYYAPWINNQIKKHAVPAMPPMRMALRTLQPTVNDATRFVAASSDRFFDDSHLWSTTFSVPEGLAALRVAINATPSGSSLHLTVHSADGLAVCDQQTDDTAVSCELNAPHSGAWKLTVTGLSWQEYQVVATSF